jgi:hypothetical protein
LKRIIIIGTALAVLVGATAAYAAFNTYGGSGLTFSPHGAGSKSKPVSLGMVETLKVNAPAGDRAAPLTDVKLTIYGANINGGKFPKCTDSMIEANPAKYDAACPAGSRIGSGPVHSLLGPSTNPAASSPPAVVCDTTLHVYNGGPATQVFFFVTPNPATCGGLRTGATAPYDNHISHQGKNLIIDTPLPPDISNKVANQPGLYGSLITEFLTFPKATRNGHGYMESVACKGHKRPWSITYTSQDYNGGGSETQTVKGNAPC